MTLAFAATNSATANDILPSTQLTFTEQQRLQVVQDLPLADMFIDADRSIWLAGRTSVWKWTPTAKRLQRIKVISPTDKDTLRFLTPVAPNLLAAASNEALILVNLEPYLVTRYEHPMLNHGKTKNLAVDGDHIIWTHQDGIIKLNAQTKVMENLKQSPRLQGDELAFFANNTGKLWIGRGQNILVRDFADANAQPKLVYRDNAPIEELACTTDECYAQTARALLRFSPSGKLSQAIPVAKDKQMLAMDIKERQHVFLFSDGYIQVQDLREKSSFTIDVTSAKIKSNVIKLRSAYNLVASLQPDAIYVFHTPLLQD